MAAETTQNIRKLHESIEKVFYGKSDAVRLLLVSLFSNGHVLLEDVPGVGKTLLARALARSINCQFQRIQFTADMLPADVTGVSVYDQDARRFVFKPGPIFANIVLADEINRTSPRTQSSLLEGMNEFQVSVDGISHPLPRPFVVLATQNPHEYEGTYPLPESELDRFFLRLTIGYPAREDEKRILKDYITTCSVEALEPVMTVADVLAVQAAVTRVRVDDILVDYMLTLVEGTRQAAGVDVGISPRGGLALFRAAQALALISGRDYVLPDDVKTVCPSVFIHRLVIRGNRDHSLNGAAGLVVDELLKTTPVPI